MAGLPTYTPAQIRQADAQTHPSGNFGFGEAAFASSFHPVAGPSTASTQGTSADTGLLRGQVSDILGLQSKAEIDAANANASDIQAAGYQQEVAAYTTAGDIASNNATVAGVAGDIKLLQEKRQLKQTLGSQRAQVASAGFRNSGSAIDLMQSSVQQGALARQLIGTQTELTKGGYLEEGAASMAEAAGANVTSAAATSLAGQQRASGALATANAASQTSALRDYIATTQNGQPLNPEQTLALGTLGAIPGQFSAPGQPATFNPATLSATGTILPVPQVAGGTVGSQGRDANGLLIKG